MLRHLKSILLISLVPTAVFGFDYRSESFDLNDFPDLTVLVWDKASDGCWTSIRSSKAYLGDKIDAAGVDVVEESENRILIDVSSSRTRATFLPYRGWRDGSCFGSVRIALYKKEPPLESNNPMNIFISSDANFTGYPNVNELVFEMIDNFVEDMRK